MLGIGLNSGPLSKTATPARSSREVSRRCERALHPPKFALWSRRADFRNTGRRSARLRIRVIDVRPPERRQVPAEVHFEVARNAVTDTTQLGTARLRIWQGQHWEDHLVTRLE